MHTTQATCRSARQPFRVVSIGSGRLLDFAVLQTNPYHFHARTRCLVAF